MSTYVLGVYGSSYNSKLIFNSPKSIKAALIQEVLENSYLEEWKKIQAHEDFLLDRSIVSDIASALGAKLSVILPKASDPKGNHEFEFKGAKVTLSKLSDYFNEAYQLYRLYTQVQASLDSNFDLYLFDVSLLDNKDYCTVLRMIFRIGRPIEIKDLKFVIDRYIKDNQIDQTFVESFDKSISVLIEKNFLEINTKDGSQFCQITEKAKLVKEAGILNR